MRTCWPPQRAERTIIHALWVILDPELPRIFGACPGAVLHRSADWAPRRPGRLRRGCWVNPNAPSANGELLAPFPDVMARLQEISAAD